MHNEQKGCNYRIINILCRSGDYARSDDGGAITNTAERFFHMNLVHNRARHNPYAHLSREQQNTINTFLVAGTLDMYRQWIAGGKTMPLDELVTLSTQLLSHGAAQFRK